MKNFSELNLPQEILSTLEKMQFSEPTPIQAQAIPFALEGRDILGSAQTGTGKTVAFAVPMVAHMMKSPTSMAVVLTPTRELAVQVMQTIKKLLGHNSPIRTALLIGGENMFRQFAQLEDGARVIVGTPGRINDHLARRSLKLDRADFLVLDETDRMLDMGFGVQIDKILTYMNGPRQTLMFSATLPRHIVNLAEKYTKNAQRVAVGSTTQPIKAIKQEMIRVQQSEKYGKLTELLDARSGSVIVFVRTKHGADRLAQKLHRENHSADAIHGDLRQNRRDKVIRLFREKKCRILVATDVAARGLDVPHIEHVINYDLPQCPEDYIHRIGRTARAGAEGEAICLVSPEENGKWAAIERLINGGEGSTAQAPSNRGGARRGRDHGGYGRKNEGGFRQERQRKPHRKGQSWQRAYDDEKARNSAPAGADAPRHERSERPQRDFKPRGDRPERDFKPRSDRPNRDFKPRDERSDRDFKPRSDRPDREFKPRSERPDREFKPRGDRPQRDFKPRGERSDRDFKPRNERPDRDFKPRNERPDREFKPRNDRPERNSKPRDGAKKTFRSDKPSWQGKKRNEGGNRPFRRDDRAA